MESIADTERARLADERDERVADARRRKTIAIAVSIAWHVLVASAGMMFLAIEAAEWVPAPSSPLAPTVVLVEDPPAHPGLKRRDPDPDDERLGPRGEPMVTINGFTFDFHKIAD